MPSRKSETKTTRTIPKTATNSDNENSQLPPPAPARVFANLVLAEDWMKPWIEAAVISGNSADACRQIGVSIADFTAARGSDHAFDSLCRTHEEIVDVKIMNTLCSHAMKGEAHALALYYKQVRTLMIEGGAKTSDQMLSASVVEAMISAGLEAKGKPPALKPSQDNAEPTRNSIPEIEED
jgi:hypothetical protein